MYFDWWSFPQEYLPMKFRPNEKRINVQNHIKSRNNSALTIYRDPFSPSNTRKTPIARPLGWDTVYPKKYEHCFCFAVLCSGYTLTDFTISIRLTSLALWQSNDCPSANTATLMNMDKYFMWIHYEWLHNHNKQSTTKPCAYFLGYTVRLSFVISKSDRSFTFEFFVPCTISRYIVWLNICTFHHRCIVIFMRQTVWCLMAEITSSQSDLGGGY